MEWSSLALATLTPGKEPTVPFGQWRQSRLQRRKKSLAPARIWTLDHPACGLVTLLTFLTVYMLCDQVTGVFYEDGWQHSQANPVLCNSVKPPSLATDLQLIFTFFCVLGVFSVDCSCQTSAATRSCEHRHFVWLLPSGGVSQTECSVMALKCFFFFGGWRNRRSPFSWTSFNYIWYGICRIYHNNSKTVTKIWSILCLRHHAEMVLQENTQLNFRAILKKYCHVWPFYSSSFSRFWRLFP